MNETKQFQKYFGPQQPQVDVCPVFLKEVTSTGKVYTALIIGGICDIEYYLPLLECLSTIGEGDSIQIWIDSPGGYINSGATISTHIVQCKGKVTTIAMGMCASAGSLIWSAGHECKFTPMATFMYHMSSHFDWGNSLAIRNEAQLQIEYVKKILLEVSLQKGHITQEELDYICNDEHARCAVWISAKEMKERLDNPQQVENVVQEEENNGGEE